MVVRCATQLYFELWVLSLSIFMEFSPVLSSFLIQLLLACAYGGFGVLTEPLCRISVLSHAAFSALVLSLVNSDKLGLRKHPFPTPQLRVLIFVPRAWKLSNQLAQANVGLTFFVSHAPSLQAWFSKVNNMS